MNELIQWLSERMAPWAVTGVLILMRLAVGCVIGFAVYAICRAYSKPKPVVPANPDSTTPVLHGFNNPVTGLILLLVVGLIVSGPCLAWFNNIMLGLLLAGSGGVLWTVGFTVHDPGSKEDDKPIVAGLLTCWNKIIRFPILWPNGMVVGGNVILLPFFPFYIDSIKLEVDVKSFEYPIEVMFKGNVPAMVKVKVVAQADLNDLPDHITAGGNMPAVFKDIESAVKQSARRACRDKELVKAIEDSEPISRELQKDVENRFTQRTYGARVILVQLIPEVPDALRTAMLEAGGETFERDGELFDNATKMLAAKEMQRVAARQFVAGSNITNPDGTYVMSNAVLDEKMQPFIARDQVKSIEHYLGQVKDLQALEDKNYKVFDTRGNGFAMIETGTTGRKGGK